MKKTNYFEEIEIMPDDYEIINCPNCFENHKISNSNHWILCGNTNRKENYMLCIRCGHIYRFKLKEIFER